jgi:hypothetical protein
MTQESADISVTPVVVEPYPRNPDASGSLAKGILDVEELPRAVDFTNASER